MSDAIKNAEDKIKQGQAELFEAVVTSWPVGISVNAAGPRGPIDCEVIGHEAPDTVVLQVLKSSAIMRRKYTSLRA